MPPRPARALPLLGLLLSAPASAGVFYQATVQGGVAVDGSGVGSIGAAATYTGPSFDVQIPSTATVTAAYVVISAKSGGFPSAVSGRLRVNGVALSSGTYVEGGTYYQVYSLAPSTFGISGSGSYSYSESGGTDTGLFGGSGVSGAALYVVYTDATLPGKRHVVLGGGDIYASTAGTAWTLTGLPSSGTWGRALVSVGIGWECADEQDGTFSVAGVTVGTGVGGRDDGDAPTGLCSTSWNSLYTVGSFGFSASTDAWLGVAGDSPTAEPGGTAANSRLSDELWQVGYAETGSLALSYATSSPDSWLSSYAVVIEMDTDDDGVRDADDVCPSVADPGQADRDSDGVGDACDTCTDADGDGYGDASLPASTCADDCDDGDVSVTVGPRWYRDGDGDTFGDAASALHACTQPSGYVADATDCDDSAAATYPGAVESCDGVDTDCDGTLDEDDAVDVRTWHRDADTDGFGDPALSDVDCAQPTGFVDDNTDCDDGDARVSPISPEVPYDGIDQDCDGADLCDDDSDGFDDPRCPGGDDCDDADPDVFPGASDPWYDGVDQDCAENDDYDADGDGFASASYGGDDCDDADAAVYPGAPDAPYDGVVTDCDGADEYDADGDGHDSADHGGDDCDDARSDVRPSGAEIWYDGVDQDCDGNDDDQDSDGYAVDEDCDDTDADVYPGSAGLDGDCEPLPGAEPDVDTGGLAGGGGIGGIYTGGAAGCGQTKTAGGLIGLGLGLLGLRGRRRRG